MRLRFVVLIAMLPAAIAFSQGGGFPKNPGNTVTIQPNAGGVTVSVASSPKSGKHGTFANETVAVGSKERRYRLDVPASLDLAKPVPLVFYFHGSGGEKSNLKPVYEPLVELARKEGFIVVYPYAQNNFNWQLELVGNSDIAFFDALYMRLIVQYPIDRKRVYLVGMSDGAIFSNLLASQSSDKIAAIAPHSGNLGALIRRGIKASYKYAVIVIHGDADHIFGIEYARGMRDAYQQEGHAVEYVELAGHGHSWAHKQNINTKIWEFFVKHSKK